LFPTKLSRRRFLYTTALAAGSSLALGIDGFAELNRISVVKLEISLLRLPTAFDGFSIAQLSDFHYDRFTAGPIQRAVEMVNQLAPDLVVLTGDFVTAPILEHGYSPMSKAAAAAPIELCATELEKLRAPAGCFAVLGNHDISTDSGRVAHTLGEHRIPVLRNRSVALERGRERIWLAGIDDAFKGRADINRALAAIPANEATILLAHEPDFADVAAGRGIDLQLSGHSHGGQIWIPGIGAPWLPPLARKYPRGLYRVGSLILYTNIGIGTIRVPLRINCPPEITFIRLRAAAA
jgi:uncharacterized protein